MSPEFELRDAHVRIEGHAILSALDLAIGSGECVALVGPSGAGKTTLLHVLAGARELTSGSVLRQGSLLSGNSRRERRAWRARTGFVHQDLGLIPILRTLHNVAAGRFGSQSTLGALRALVRPSKRSLLEIHAALERVGIGDKLYQRTDSLSGGEAQRAAIARVLYQAPRALLADEPVSSVDPARARGLLELFLELSREQGWTLVCSLHDIELAKQLFPRWIGLRAGRIVFDEAPGDTTPQQLAQLFRLEDARDAAHAP